MDSDPTTAQDLILAAMRALKEGDRLAARRYAEQAAVLAPQTEQPWLLLSYLASPKAAQFYLDRALQINPTSQQALSAQAWLNKQAAISAPPAASYPSDPAAPTAPIVVTAPPAPADAPRPRPKFPRILRYAAILGVAVAVLVGLVSLNGAVRIAESQANSRPKPTRTVPSAAPTLEPSLTPSLTWTVAPSATLQATATGTASPVPTETASPAPTDTASPEPTRTPTAIPTATPSNPTATPSRATATPSNPTRAANTRYSVVSGDTLSLIAARYNISVQDLIAANNLTNPSLIRAGQVLTIPAPGSPPAAQPTAASPSASASTSGKWILIDISEQRTYAYEDKKLVYNFVASTGIGNSTRIGTFKVLDKIPNAYSNAFNIWMPYWMGIYYSGSLENGIHGLPKLWNGVELWASLLGQPATYGCIESKTSEAKLLYDWAEVGIPVVIQR